MRTGIMVRDGPQNVDLIDLKPWKVYDWCLSLTPQARTRTIQRLLDVLRQVKDA